MKFHTMIVSTFLFILVSRRMRREFPGVLLTACTRAIALRVRLVAWSVVQLAVQSAV